MGVEVQSEGGLEPAFLMEKIGLSVSQHVRQTLLEGAKMKWGISFFKATIILSVLFFAWSFLKLNDRYDEFPVWLMLLVSLIPASVLFVFYYVGLFVVRSFNSGPNSN